MPRGGQTSRSHFTANNTGLRDAFRLGLRGHGGKATQRLEWSQQPPGTSGPGKMLLLQDQEEETKSLGGEAIGEAVQREVRRWPGLGLLREVLPIQENLGGYLGSEEIPLQGKDVPSHWPSTPMANSGPILTSASPSEPTSD